MRPWSVSPDEEWERVRLALGPATRLLHLAWDVADWTPELGAPARRGGWLVLRRVAANTGAERVEDGPGAVLDTLARGATLGEACNLAGSLGMSADDLCAAFAHWRARGWVTRRGDGGHCARGGLDLARNAEERTPHPPDTTSVTVSARPPYSRTTSSGAHDEPRNLP